MKSFIGQAAIAALLAAASFSTVIGTATHANAATSTAPPAAGSTSNDRFPYLLPLTFEVESADDRALSSLKSLTVTAQGSDDQQATTVLGPVDPFRADNQCASPAPAGIAACAVNGDATVGTLRVDWKVPRPGTYRFVISAQRGTHEQPDTIAVFDLEATN